MRDRLWFTVGVDALVCVTEVNLAGSFIGDEAGPRGCLIAAESKVPVSKRQEMLPPQPP